MRVSDTITWHSFMLSSQLFFASAFVSASVSLPLFLPFSTNASIATRVADAGKQALVCNPDAGANARACEAGSVCCQPPSPYPTPYPTPGPSPSPSNIKCCPQDTSCAYPTLTWLPSVVCVSGVVPAITGEAGPIAPDIMGSDITQLSMTRSSVQGTSKGGYYSSVYPFDSVRLWFSEQFHSSKGDVSLCNYPGIECTGGSGGSGGKSAAEDAKNGTGNPARSPMPWLQLVEVPSSTISSGGSAVNSVDMLDATVTLHQQYVKGLTGDLPDSCPSNYIDTTNGEVSSC